MSLLEDKCELCTRSFILADLEYVFVHKPDALTKTREVEHPVTGGTFLIVCEILPKEACTKVCLDCYGQHRHKEFLGYALVPYVADGFAVHVPAG